MKFLLIAGYAESLINFRGPLLEALKQKGMDVHVAAPDLPLGNPTRLRLEAMGYSVHSIPLSRVGMNPISDLSALIHLWQLMRHIHPQWVLSYTVKPVIYGLLAARMARVPRRYALITGLGYAFQGQEGGDNKRKLIRSLVQGLYGLALRGAHKVFFQNPDDKKLFKDLKLLGPATPSVTVNGSGVDVAQFQVQSFPQQVDFLLIARLLGDKGVREYAQAARQVRALYPDVTFSLVGWIDDNPDAITQTELDAWISEGAVRYLGRLADVRPAITACSVYVLPSYREGTPRTVLEAMAMGRPVITTDAPGCRETVIDGVNGFLVPVKCAAEIARAMVFFIENPEQVIEMGKASRELAEQKYDVHKVNDFMLQEMDVSCASH